MTIPELESERAAILKRCREIGPYMAQVECGDWLSLYALFIESKELLARADKLRTTIELLKCN